VKLQVQSDQLEDAKRILEENGIKLEIEDELNPLYFKLINLANAVPGVNKLPETIKVLIIFLFFVVIMIGLISLVLNVLYE
jgi:ATP:corrinoid adenosyltransferase